MKILSYRDLIAWQKAMELVVQAYHLTTRFPPDERFGLTAQMRRSAVSVASNIAEGRARGTQKEFVHFLSIAYGSLAELETQEVMLAERLTFAGKDTADAVLNLAGEVGRLINGLTKSLEAKSTDT